MHIIQFFLLLISLFVVSFGQVSNQEQELYAKLMELNWQVTPGVYHLAKSHITLTLPEGYIVLLNKDNSNTIESLIGISLNEVEAIILSKDFKSILWLRYNNSGYKPWRNEPEVNTDESLQELGSMLKNTGIIQQCNWLEKPTKDNKTYTEYYASENLDDDGTKVVLASASKRGHYGTIIACERINKVSYVPFGSGSKLETVLNGLSFDLGFRYEDHFEGDNCPKRSLIRGLLFILLVKFIVFIINWWLFIVIGMIIFFIMRRRKRKRINSKDFMVSTSDS